MLTSIAPLDLLAGILFGIGCLIAMALFFVGMELFNGSLSFQNIHAMREAKRASKRAHKERLAQIKADAKADA